MKKTIINVGRGGYGYATSNTDLQLATDDLQYSAALIVTSQQTQKTALFNIDQLVDDKVLIKTILHVFPDSEPLYFRLPPRREPLYLASSTAIEDFNHKERIAINQINQATIIKTLKHHDLAKRIRHIDKSLTQNKIKHAGFIFSPASQCYHEYQNGDQALMENMNINGQYKDEHYCQRHFAQCYRQFGGFAHPPMIDFFHYQIHLTQKNIDCMLKGHWLLEKRHNHNIHTAQDANTEFRLFFIHTYDSAKNLAIKTIALADKQHRLWHEHREKLHDLLILHFLNSPFGYKLLSVNSHDLEQPIKTLANIIEKAIYQEKNWFSELKSRLVGGNVTTRLTLNPSLSSNITQILLNSCHDSEKKQLA